MQDLKPGTLLIAERPMLVSLHDSVDSAHPDNPDSPDYPLDYDGPDVPEDLGDSDGHDDPDVLMLLSFWSIASHESPGGYNDGRGPV